MRFFNSQSVRRRSIVVVWLLGMLLATILIARRPSSQIRGLGFVESVVLAAPSDGALAEFEVSLHESVVAGDLIARFDPHLLAARREVLVAEIEALIETETADRQGRTRVFERDREEAGLELGALTARVEESEARVAALYEQLAIDEKLFDEGVGSAEKAEGVRREITVVETRLAADRERLDLARRSASQASRRAGAAPGTHQWQIEAARRELAEVEKRIDTLSLRTSISGQVTEVYRQPGEWLEAGDRVLRISPLTAAEIYAWLDSRAAPSARAGLETEIRRSTGQQLTGNVTSVSVERLQMPQELWARSDAPEWGYLMRIAIVDGVVAPGEPVQVGLR